MQSAVAREDRPRNHDHQCNMCIYATRRTMHSVHHVVNSNRFVNLTRRRDRIRRVWSQSCRRSSASSQDGGRKGAKISKMSENLIVKAQELT